MIVFREQLCFQNIGIFATLLQICNYIISVCRFVRLVTMIGFQILMIALQTHAKTAASVPTLSIAIVVIVMAPVLQGPTVTKVSA